MNIWWSISYGKRAKSAAKQSQLKITLQNAVNGD